MFEECEDDQLNTDYVFGRPILGKILILPRSAARNFIYEKPWACISIATEHDELPKINMVQRVDLLQLVFEDLEFCPASSPEKAKSMFAETHAQQILEFSKKWWDNIDLLMVHCYAGISRSPAVGKALSDIYQPKFSDFFDVVFSPNKLVYSIIKNHMKNNLFFLAMLLLETILNLFAPRGPLMRRVTLKFKEKSWED